MYSQDDLVPISALQHLMFCERQAALIHIEQVWAENVLTVEGQQLHENVHEEDMVMVGNIRSVRSLRVRSLRLGLVGMTDVVEFHRVGHADNAVEIKDVQGWWKPEIVEFKRGKPKIDHTDEVQLCAQALCLEEMLSVSIPESSFFYGEPRRRHKVILGSELRKETEEAAARFHNLLESGITPPAQYTGRCRQCSLIDLCMPKLGGKSQQVKKYLESIITNQGEEVE